MGKDFYPTISETSLFTGLPLRARRIRAKNLHATKQRSLEKIGEMKRLLKFLPHLLGPRDIPDTVLKGRNPTGMQRTNVCSVLQDGPVGPHTSLLGDYSVVGLQG